jgi:hypothetical protein
VGAHAAPVAPQGADAARPADVLAARERWRPSLGTLGADDAARARELVQRASAGLDGPRIIVNRHPAEAAALLDGSIERLSTTNDRARLPFRPQSAAQLDAAADRRLRLEQRHGTVGTGAARGTTTYGTVAWDSTALTPGGRTVPQLGAYRYGQAAMVLDERVLDRATFLPHDSVSVAHGTRTAAREQLVDVAVERLARSHGFVDDLAPGGRPAPRIPDAERAARQRRLLDILHAPDRVAVDAMRDELRRTPNSTHYVEAQVRGGVRADDVAEVRLATRPNMAPRWATTPRLQRLGTSALDALEGVALLRRIPLLRVR